MRPVAFVQFVQSSHGKMPLNSLAAQLRETLEPFLVPDMFLEMPPEDAARMKHSRAALAQRLAQGERFRQLD